MVHPGEVLDEELDHHELAVSEWLSGGALPLHFGALSSKECGLHAASVAAQDKCAFFVDGTLLVAEGASTNIHVMTYKSDLAEKGLLKRQFIVPYQFIQRIYKEGSTGLSRDGVASGDASTAQQEKFFNILLAAKEALATDIHILVDETKAVVKFRILSSVEEAFPLSALEGKTLIRTVYNSMADEVDSFYEESRDQGGRLKKSFTPAGMKPPRIAVGPTDDGVYMAVRLHDEHGKLRTLQELGYSARHENQIQEMGMLPAGLILFSGPTGSGKTTAMANFLELRMQQEAYSRNLITVEDPPELPITGAVRKAVSRRNGSSAVEDNAWAESIDSIMRWDPDWILIGEMRRPPAMKAGLKAALTNHLVYSSIHASDANACQDRLREGGIELSYLTDPNVYVGFINQSLVSANCPKCSVPFLGNENKLGQQLRERVMSHCDPAGVMLRGDGCAHCRHKGIAGRTVVAEVIRSNKQFMSAYAAGGSRAAREYWYHHMDGQTKYQHMIDKLNIGLIDPVEAERLVGPIDHDLVSLGERMPGCSNV